MGESATLAARRPQLALHDPARGHDELEVVIMGDRGGMGLGDRDHRVLVSAEQVLQAGDLGGKAPRLLSLVRRRPRAVSSAAYRARLAAMRTGVKFGIGRRRAGGQLLDLTFEAAPRLCGHCRQSVARRLQARCAQLGVAGQDNEALKELGISVGARPLRRGAPCGRWRAAGAGR